MTTPKSPATKQQAHAQRCTIKCPACRDDDGSFWCRIKREYVAPFEYRSDYGFEVIKDGKIVRAGYHTDCDALNLFDHTTTPTIAAYAIKGPDGELLLWTTNKTKELSMVHFNAVARETAKSTGYRCVRVQILEVEE